VASFPHLPFNIGLEVLPSAKRQGKETKVELLEEKD
jgi:hypothetical protein